MVGSLYPKASERKDAGFTLFYMGINLGSFTATLLCGYLGETYGWGYGFGAAGIGMLLGLITFLYGQKHLHGHAEPHDPEILKERSPSWARSLMRLARSRLCSARRRASCAAASSGVNSFLPFCTCLYLLYMVLSEELATCLVEPFLLVSKANRSCVLIMLTDEKYTLLSLRGLLYILDILVG